jgi:hypothetical protein
MALSLLISSLIVVWSGLSIVSSATAVNALLASAGAYEQAAVFVSSSMSSMLSNADVPKEYRDTIGQVFEKTITPAQVEVVFQPLLVDIISWMDQPKGTPQPQLVLNLAPVKARLEEEFKKTNLSEIEQTVIISQVAKQMPDQLDLGNMKSLPDSNPSVESGQVPLTGVESFDTLLGPSQDNSQEAPSSEAILNNIKDIYTWLRAAANVGTGIMLMLFGLLVWLGRKDGRKMFTRPAWIFFSAGIITALFWLFAQLYHPDDSQIALSTIMNVAREIVSVSIWYGAAALATGAVLYGLSLVIKKQPAASSNDLVNAVKNNINTNKPAAKPDPPANTPTLPSS